MTDSDLLTALRDCYDPVLKRNIVELALVRSASVHVDPDAPGAGIPGVPSRFVAHLTLYAPSTDDAANSMLVAQIENRLAGLEAVSRTEVSLLPAPFPILR